MNRKSSMFVRTMNQPNARMPYVVYGFKNKNNFTIDIIVVV